MLPSGRLLCGTAAQSQWGWLMRKHLVVVLGLEPGATRPARALSALGAAAECSVNPTAPLYAAPLPYRLSLFFQNSGVDPC